jgi:hypothetical protein
MAPPPPVLLPSRWGSSAPFSMHVARHTACPLLPVAGMHSPACSVAFCHWPVPLSTRSPPRPRLSRLPHAVHVRGSIRKTIPARVHSSAMLPAHRLAPTGARDGWTSGIAACPRPMQQKREGLLNTARSYGMTRHSAPELELADHRRCCCQYTNQHPPGRRHGREASP